MVSLSTLEKDVAIIAAALKWSGVIAMTFVSTTVAFATWVAITLHQNETNTLVQQTRIDGIEKKVDVIDQRTRLMP